LVHADKFLNLMTPDNNSRYTSLYLSITAEVLEAFFGIYLMIEPCVILIENFSTNTTRYLGTNQDEIH